MTEHNIDQLEGLIRLSVQKGDAPFLGLQKRLFMPNMRKSIHENQKMYPDPFGAYLIYLTKWPAVFLTYLILYVTEGFGVHGTFEVYPFIEKALNLRGMTNAQKEKLWKAFRKYCIQLGLSVSSRLSGTHFMVDEYLHQAGFPLNYVPELTEKMVRFANDIGLPDDDDPASISLWQQGLCERLYVPFPRTARKAIEADDSGYYVRTFLKLLEKPAENVQSGDFESLMSQAIHNEEDRSKTISAKRRHGIVIPQVIWQDQQLGVELPPGESNFWKVSVGNVSKKFPGMLEKRFVPFDQELPSEVVVEHQDGIISRKFILWEDDKNNRLLIFSSEGVLARATRLGVEETILLEPGNYQVLSRFIPDGMESIAEEVRNDPALYTFPIFLGPGQKLDLTRGPTFVSFKADTKPLLIWEGTSINGVRGQEVFCSTGTRLKIMIPEEFMLAGEARYLFRLSPGLLGMNEEIPAKNSIDGYFEIDIEEVSRKWKPGVTRLLAEIYRQGIQRSIARSAIYLWNGLERVENRTKFCCSNLPTNLMQDESDNLLVNADNIFLSYRNADNRFFRMVFDLGNDKQLIFTSVVPGIFLQLKDFSVSQPTERLLKKGTILSVAWNSRSVLEIYSTANGYLQLGEFRKKVDFNNCGCKRFPLSGLVGYLGPTTNSLQFEDEATGHLEDLLYLVSPYEVLDFSISRQSNFYHILFTLAQESSGINLTATEMLSGRSEILTLECDCFLTTNDSGINGWLTRERDDLKGLYNHDLTMFLDKCPNGAWIIELNVNIAGRWGGITNAHGDVYAGGFILMESTIHTNLLCLCDELKSLKLDEKLTILKQVHIKLLSCYARESWEELKWLKTLWGMLLEECTEKEECAPDLLSITDPSAPEDASHSWVPMVSLSARCPWLFTLPVRYFRHIPSCPNSLLIKCLRTMSSIEFGLLPMFTDSILHQIFAIGFSNIHRMMQGEEPYRFSIKKYEQAMKMLDLTERLRLLKQDDWQPGEGDYLGALHYLYAMEKLQQLYLDTHPGNERRRGKAVYLCKSFQQYTLYGLPDHLGNDIKSLSFIQSSTGSELSVEQESILQIASFLSLFARVCRWELRKQGTLEQFIAKAKSAIASQEQFESVLGYILYIGKEIFSFYLLLWEVVLTSDYKIGGDMDYV